MSDPPAADRRVVVIGAGVAGIAAAVHLARLGLTPLLLEARPYIGGRVRSFVNEGSGEEIDNGQHLMLGCYDATFRLLDELGTRHLVDLQPRLTIAYRDSEGGRDLLQAPRLLPPPLSTLVAIAGMRSLARGDVARLLRVAFAARRGDVRDGERVAEWLERTGQRGEIRRRLWEPMVIATLNTPVADASAALFVEVLRRGFLAPGRGSSLAIPTVPLSRLFSPIVEYLRSRGGELLTRYEVRSLRRQDQQFVVDLAGGGSLPAEGVVVALPPRPLARTIDPALQHAAGIRPSPALPMSPIVSLHLWYDRALATIPPITALIGTSLQWVFNRRAIERRTAETGHLSGTISAAVVERGLSGEEIAARADAELRNAFPELHDARLVRSLVIKEKEATFMATPEVERIRPDQSTRVEGLALAGDWTATGLPATIEGAALSGERAASIVAQQLLRRPGAGRPGD